MQAFLIIQLEVLSSLAVDLGKFEESEAYIKKAECALENMLTHCFNEGRPVALTSGKHKCVDNNSLILYESLILGKKLPEIIRKNMIEVLKSDQFLTAYGFATESPVSSDYCADGYWRGPIWAPSTMILLDALNECGEKEMVKDAASTKWFRYSMQKFGFCISTKIRTVIIRNHSRNKGVIA